LKFFAHVAVFGAVLLAAGMTAQAGVVVSVGYYDLTALNPWTSTANTDFLGNLTIANSGDPDEAAILLQNTGGSAVTLQQGFKVDAGASVFQLWDTLIGAGGFTIQPGHNLILSSTDNCSLCSNFDGSEFSFTQNPVLSFTLNGGGFSNQAVSFTDTNRVLHGANEYDESIAWTQIGTANPSVSGVPEPGTFILMGLPLFAAGALRKLRRQN
jgi:hypothetical protein